MKPTKQFLTFALLIFMVLLGCNKDDNTIISPDPQQQEPEKPIVPEKPDEIDVELTL